MQQKGWRWGGLDLGARLSGKAHDDDEPRTAHREPAEDVWHHAPDVVERALRAHKVVAPLLGHGQVGVLDVVERPVLVPLVLREQLERARVGVVVGAPVFVLALAEFVELVGADRVGVPLLVDEGLGHRDVPARRGHARVSEWARIPVCERAQTRIRCACTLSTKKPKAMVAQCSMKMAASAFCSRMPSEMAIDMAMSEAEMEYWPVKGVHVSRFVI